jgi:hypothetical protein
VEKLRKQLKEQFGFDSSRINPDRQLFSKIPDKASPLGCLEFKYHCEQIDIDNKVKELKPFLNDLGVTYFSVIKMSNIFVVTVNKRNAEEVKNICLKFGLSLVKETFSDSPKPHNAQTQDNNAPDANGVTDYGRASSDGRSSFTGGSMMTGYPVDRLAGE